MQPAALEHNSGEIVKMVVLYENELKCNSNSLEPLGVAKIIDQSFSDKIFFLVISKDESSQVKTIRNRIASKQEKEWDKNDVAECRFSQA